MRHALGFLVPLLLFLGVLAWGASIVVNTTSRRWFEKDVSMRAQLAASGAREALVLHWKSGDRRRVATVLTDLARDGRVMAAAACGVNGALFAATRECPKGLGCELLRSREAPGTPSQPHPAGWDESRTLAGGRVHLSIMPIADGEQTLGYLFLVHDLSFADQREAATRRFLLGGSRSWRWRRQS